MSDLTGRVALISGAGGGQGIVAAELFAEAGARLVLTDRDVDALEKSRSVAEAAGAEVLAVPADVTVAADRTRLLDESRARFGGIDILYNNVGVVAGGSLEDYDESGWDRVFDVNVKSYFFLVQAALPLLRASPSAAIINVSSLAGLVGVPGATVYGASKGAVVALTKNLAVELAADEIRVNCIASGTLDTPMPRAYLEQFPAERQEAVRNAWTDRQLFKRLGDPEEVVRVALFLASDDSSFMTGAVLNVDGGWLSW